MKKIIHYLGGMAFALAVASCSSDEPTSAPDTQGGNPPVESGEVATVTFSADIPAGMRSRTVDPEPEFSAADLTHLYCGIYTQASQSLVVKQILSGDELKAAIQDGKISVKFTLNKTDNYIAWFWGDNSTSQLVDLENKTARIDDFKHSYNSYAFCSEKIAVNLNNATHYTVSLRRPYAEIALVSDQTETSVFQAKYTTGPFMMFGKPVSSNNNGDVELPESWNFMTDQLTWKTYHIDTTFTDFKNDSYHQIYDGCKTMMIRPVLVGYTPQEARYSFRIYDTPVPAGSHFSVDTKPMSLQRNKRYIFVDKGDNGGGGSGDDGGSIFTTKTTFSVIIDNNFEGDETEEL